MLIEIRQNISDIGEESALYRDDNIAFFVKEEALYTNPNRKLFATQEPVFLESESSSTFFRTEQLSRFQNEVSGVAISNSLQEMEILLFSAKLSRSRLFFIFSNNSLFFSDDLRKLLPYSKRKLRKEIAYSIVKFGETPEYLTIIEDVFTIPCGEYLSFSSKVLRQFINSKNINSVSFQRYFTIDYSEKGGSLLETQQVLMDALNSIKAKSPILFVSGGIDSTLLNYLYNEISETSYPAFFLDFSEAPEELYYAKKSVQNTKAEFIPISLDNSQILNDFVSSINQLIYPVYDNGSALVGYQLRRHLTDRNSLRSLSFIDGTLADSCYGVRNYNYQLKEGKKQPEYISILKEWFYLKAIFYGVAWKGTKPRDAYLNDEFLQDLLWNSGPYVNFWFHNAKEYTSLLKKEYEKYFNVLSKKNSNEYWPKYTVMKMLLYAAKQTTVKVYDMLQPGQVYFPFMYRNVLADQGKYTWQEKSENNIIKAPLKKILGNFIDSEFIHRKKVGLQSQTRSWILAPTIKPFIQELISRKDGVAKSMMRYSQNDLVVSFSKETPENSLVSLVLALSVIQIWCDNNNINIG